jgi:hypothetical protein
MKTIKKITKALVRGYINNFKESAKMQYGYLYNK